MLDPATMQTLMAMRIPRVWSTEARIQRVFDSLRPASTDTVLDLGCGNGRLLEALRERSHGSPSLVGIEIDHGTMLEACRLINGRFGIVFHSQIAALADEGMLRSAVLGIAPTLVHCYCGQEHHAAVSALVATLPSVRKSYVGV